MAYGRKNRDYLKGSFKDWLLGQVGNDFLVSNNDLTKYHVFWGSEKEYKQNLANKRHRKFKKLKEEIILT